METATWILAICAVIELGIIIYGLIDRGRLKEQVSVLQQECTSLNGSIQNKGVHIGDNKQENRF